MKRTGITKRMGSLLVQIVLAMSFLCGCSSKSQDISVNAVDGVRRGIKLLGEAFVERPVEYEPCTLRFSWKQDETKNQAFLLECLIFNYVYILLQIQCLEPIDGRFVKPHFLTQEAVHTAVYLVNGLKGRGDEVLLHGVKTVDKLKHRLVVGKLAAVIKQPLRARGAALTGDHVVCNDALTGNAERRQQQRRSRADTVLAHGAVV